MNLNATQGSPYQGLIQTRPYDFGTDAIERERVSLGQAMMDADFEYGLQATKWQTYYDTRKFPTFFEIPGTDATVSNVVSDGAAPYSNITVYYSNAISQPQVVGGVISMFGLGNLAKNADRAEGYYIITSNSASANTANYIAKGYVPSGNVQTNLTFSKRGGVYNSGTMNIIYTSVVTNGSNIQVFTSNAHGILPGSPVTVLSNIGATNGWTANGTYIVCNVSSTNTFNIVANTLSFTSCTQTYNSNTVLIPSQYSSSQHRPYDGGVLLSTLAPAHGSTIVRQSKKAFRYQSGKGILFSSGTLFCPNLDIASMNIYGLTTTLTSNSNGLTGVTLAVSQPTLIGLNQNVTFSTGQSSFLNSNVSAISGSNVTFVYNGTFPSAVPATVTQNVVSTNSGGFQPGAALAVPISNTSGFSAGPATFAGIGTFTIASTTLNTSLNLSPFPYTPIPGGTVVTQGTASNVTTASTSTSPLNLTVASTNGFVIGETVTLTPAISALGTLAVVSNVAPILGLSYTGLASTATTTVPQYTTISGVPVGVTGTFPITANIAGSQIFSPGQVVASYLGLNLGNVTITGTQTVASNAQVNLAYSGSFPPSGIPTGTVITTVPPGSNIQVVTDLVHGIPTTGATVIIRNVGSSNINGTGYTVTGVLDSRTLNVQSQSTILSTSINYGDQPRLVVSGWHGSSVRAGVFEDPNGMFWEYDGQTLYVVRRQSTFDCAGYVTTSPYSQILVGSSAGLTGTITTSSVSVGRGDTTATLIGPAHTVLQNMYSTIAGLGYVWVVGIPDYFEVQIGFSPAQTAVTIGAGSVNFTAPSTRFQDQLKVNDRVTIRGMVYQVTSIQGQGVLTFTPPYRGTTVIDSAHPVKMCKIKELRIPQSSFNRDTMDGMGPSGYKVDLTRMQMIGIQYTWYGAGFIDFMMRGPDGNWVYAHRIRNNNVNDEAYMRSGNLPVRYELTVETRAAVTSLAAPVSNTLATTASTTQNTDTITVNDATTFFPPFGTLLIDNELINYSNATPYGFTGLSRAYPLTYVINDVQRTLSGSSNTSHYTGTSVNLVSCTATPTLTHWGSSFITDGQFDVERGYYFNYSNVNVTLTNSGAAAGSNACAFALRLAPTVTNGLCGDIGTKELLNRAQLLLQRLEVTAPMNVQTLGFLNPTGITLSPNNWINVNTPANGTQPSFVQFYPGNLITGIPQPGERIFSTIVQANNQNTLDLSALKEMTNSVIGGNQNFPDGPDALVVYLQSLVPGTGGSNVVQVNLFWSEAQA